MAEKFSTVGAISLKIQHRLAIIGKIRITRRTSLGVDSNVRATLGRDLPPFIYQTAMRCLFSQALTGGR
jgi:hypothetical protein